MNHTLNPKSYIFHLQVLLIEKCKRNPFLSSSHQGYGSSRDYAVVCSSPERPPGTLHRAVEVGAEHIPSHSLARAV